MKKIPGRVLLCLVTAMLIFQTAAASLFVTDSAEDDAVTAGEEATLMDERSDHKGVKTIYSLSDYEKNEVLVLYEDGSLSLVQCESRRDLEEQLTLLEKDRRVEAYQPDFTYSADSVITESAESSSLPVFYGAPDEVQTIPELIRKREAVNIAEPHPSVPSDPYYYLQWALNNNGTFTGASDDVIPKQNIDINAPEAWKRYRAKRSVIVALIDTGIEYMNPEIRESIWTNTGEIPDNGLDDDGNGFIDDVRGWNFYNNNNRIYAGSEDDHGTHCATSMMAASNHIAICGIADYSNIRLMSLKALGGEIGEGTTLSIMKAIQYAEQNGALICNLSLGTNVNDYLLYKTMKNSRMLFVTAAGNSSDPEEKGKDIDQDPCYPASYTLANILSVSNINASGMIHYTSNYGKASVDLAAPGTDILGISSQDHLAFMTGTSMAAPMVTAAAAMTYTASWSRTVQETADIIRYTVKPVPGLSEITATGGMLDLAAAVEWK